MSDRKRRLRRLEEAAKSLSDSLLLEDGSRVVLAPHDRLESLLAAMEGESHPLHEVLPRLSEDADDEAHELASLLKAFGVGEEG